MSEQALRNRLRVVAALIKRAPHREIGSMAYGRLCSAFWKLRNKVADLKKERGEYA